MGSGSGFGFSEPSESGAPTPWIPNTPARKLVNSSSTSSVSPFRTENSLSHIGHSGGSFPIGVQQNQQHPRYYGINGLSENQSQSHILKPQVRSHPTEGWVQVPLGNGATYPNSTFMFPNPYAMQDVAYSPMLRRHSVQSSSEAVGRAVDHESMLSPSAPSTPANNSVRNAYGRRGVYLENDMFSTGQHRQTENRIDSYINRDSFQLCFTQGASTASPLPHGQFSWLPQNQHQAVNNRVHGAKKSVHFSVAPSTPCRYSTTQNDGPSEVIDLVDHEATKKNGLELNGNVYIEKEQRQTSFDLNVKIQEVMPPRECVLPQLDNQKEGIEENQDIDLSKTPQQKPRRKKHRPKVIREGKPERKPRTAAPNSAVTTSAEKPSGKRKYTRRKGVSVDTPLTVNGQTIDTGNVIVRKATKRSLNFDSDVIGKGDHQQSCLRPMSTNAAEHVADVAKDDNSLSYKEKITTMKRVKEVESASTLLDLNNASKMAPGNISTSHENSVPDSMHSRRESVMRNIECLARFKERIKNHSSFGSVLPSGFEGSNQFAPPANNMISNGSTCSSAAASGISKTNYNLYLGADRHRYQNSTVHNSLLKQTANRTLNDNRVTYNGYQLNSLPSMSMGNKKENWSLGIVSSSTESTINGQAQLSYPCNRTLSFAQSQAAHGKLQDAGQVVKHLHEQRKRKAQSMEPMPVCNQQMSTPRQFPAHAGRMSVNSRDQIVGNSQLTQPTQTTNQLLGGNLLSFSSKVTCQQDVSFRCSSNQTLVGTTFQPQGKRSRNSSRKLNPPRPDLVEVAIQKLKCLTISDTSKCIDQGIQAQNAIVPYEGNGPIVPFVPLSKRAIRPKVDLDPESNRVWMLLMGNEARDGADVRSKDKEKWWEEERRVFRGRIDSFIARMHLVQGDRRFSRWKGSVVDSVVGVFLTQNVTDHLSSSAFMSLAARFPPRSYCESRKSFIIEANSSQTNQPLSTMEIDDKVKQDVQSQRDIDQNFKPSCQSQDTKKKKNEEDIPSERDSIDGKTDVQSEIIGVGKEMELAVASPSNKITTYSAQCIHLNEVDDNMSPESVPSSQNSVISSQHSSDSPTPIVEPTALTADLNPDIEDLFSGNRWNCLEASTSFMQLLQMAGSGTSFHEPYQSVGVESTECYSREVMASPGFENQRTCQKDGIDNPCLPLDGNNFRFPIKEFNLTDASGGTSVSSTSRMLAHSGLPGLKTVDEVGKIRPSFTSFTSGVTNDTCLDFSGNVNVPLVKNAADYQKKSTVASPSLCVLHSGTPEFISNNNTQHKFSKTAYSRATESLQIERTDLWKNKENNTLCQPKYSFHEHSALHSESVTSACVSDNSKPPSAVEMKKTALRNGTESSSPDAYFSNNVPSEKGRGAVKPVRRKFDKARKACDWDTLRKEVNCSSNPERNSSANDTVDWEAVRDAKVEEVSNTIRERGMNNMLAERIKDFLERLVQDHECIDLEWLRDVPPDKAKDYLLSIRGLGLKSVECIRLLTLHHLAFPVDTNVGRICVRLGWVPLQPLPESLQLHLLELYPMLETIQKYLWPRLCTLDQRTLYELHYQLITFGKVFCTKHKPNCNACPMRGECKHFASAFASARLALPGPEEKGLVTSMSPIGSNIIEKPTIYSSPLPQIEGNAISQGSAVSSQNIQAEGNTICQRPVVTTVPIIEEPATPEPEPESEPESEYLENLQSAIEKDFYEDPDEIPTIKLNVQQFTQNLQDIMQHKNIQEGDMSKALVALTPEAASIPQPKLKNISRLRTEHQVYELPDSHPLLKGLEEREKDDPCPYLLSIWTPGETAQSTESPDLDCTTQDRGKLCDRKICFSCNSVREDQAQKVRGTILIPCRTAMRGSFPLNGTYFQVNEVFADHCSSINPIDVPREWIWNLPRRTVYFGTSVTSIFRGLTTEGIQQCFWKGFVCVRGFDQITRAPRPLFARLHLAASKVIRNKKTPMKEDE